MSMSTEDMKQQVLAIVQNHKRGTVRGVASITGFPQSFIEKVLDSYVEAGILKTSPFYTENEEKVNERIWRPKKKFIQQDLFTSDTEEEEDD